MRRFRRLFKGDLSKNQDKEQNPVMFIYYPDVFMDHYHRDFRPVADEIHESFDIFYCKDAEVAKQYFYLKEFPEVMPFVAIVDPKRQEPLVAFKNPNEKV